ncbi:MAG TPA: hypothetical protein VHU85_12230 [Acidimicrobiales bacterium]|nr:hypothetical protein [Acidimicrobiales bacterium]
MTWFGQRNGEEQSVAAASTRLIADAEAFLSGDYADHLSRNRESVPAWAWINAFAHGDLSRVRRARRGFGARELAEPTEGTDESWRIAQRIVADQLLEIVRGDRLTLSYVQETVLVPLELMLMYERSLTAFDMVQVTRAALRWPNP